MSMLLGMALAAAFLIGALFVVLGVVGIDRRRILPGGVLLLLGLALAIWSGQELRERYFLSQMEKKIESNRLSLSHVRAERERVEQQKTQLKQDSDQLVKQLRAKIGKDGNFDALQQKDVDVRGLVDKTAQAQRWLAECDKAITELLATEKTLENNLFYLRNLDAMSRIGDEKVGAELAKDYEKRLADQAGTPKGGPAPLPVSDTEVQKVKELVSP